MLEKFWQLLMLYLVLGVGDDDPPADPPADDPPADDPPADDPVDGLPGDDLDSLIETVENGGDGKPKGGRENDTIRTLREEKQRETEARIRAEAERDAHARIRNAQPSDEQRIFEEEEQKLRNSEVSETEKWQIRSNRTLRANTNAANQAFSTAADMRDQMEFDRLRDTNPKVHKLYAPKVEKALNEARAKGQSIPRLALLRFLIGDDIVNGKVKSAKKAAAAAPAGTVNRGKSPGARSDTNGKGRGNEHDARKERLRNVIL